MGWCVAKCFPSRSHRNRNVWSALLVDGSEAEQYILPDEAAYTDVYASVGNDAAAILCTPIGESMFSMGGDTTVLLTRAKDDVEEEDETEMEDAE